MTDLPTTLLHHLGYGAPHYDWLLARDDDGPLLTFRVDRPTADWLDAGRLELTPLGEHRRVYLTYEGPVSGGRGTVSRVDHGIHRPGIWAPNRIVTSVFWQDATLKMELFRQSDALWLADVEAGASAEENPL